MVNLLRLKINFRIMQVYNNTSIVFVVRQYLVEKMQYKYGNELISSTTTVLLYLYFAMFRLTPGQEVHVQCSAWYQRREPGPQIVQFKIRIQ